MRIKLKVVPRASRTEFAGWLGDRLKLRLAAVPENGRANAALVKYLAAALSVSGRRVRVVAGHVSVNKTVEIEGVDEHYIGNRLPPR